MSRFARWRDQSHFMNENPARWVPEAMISLSEGSTTTEKPVYVSDADAECLERDELIYSTHKLAWAAAYHLAITAIWHDWGIGEDGIQELIPERSSGR
jgi:hypothetical protein